MEMWKNLLHLLSGFVLLAMCTPAMGRLAVMSIDLGGEFMKIAIVKPGVPMEIVLNKESSRKTQSIVAFRDGERHFANEAHSTGIKYPSKAFWFLTHIVGRTYDDPMVVQFRQRFPYYGEIMVKDDERGTVAFRIHDDIVYSVEELLAMMLEKAREYAQDFAEHDVRDVVITVPPYFNQAERRAIFKAAELVGLNVLQLMNDNTAVALNYGVFRRKMFTNITQYYMFYDMGSTSTVATVVAYQMIKTKEGTRVESNPQLTIKGVGYDRNLGGLEMTLRLRDHLAKVFNSQKNVKVEENPRAMAKLLKEAERVKKVLSANADHKAQVEGLLEEMDFAARITREEYLDLIKDLLDRIYKPVEEALRISEITLPELNEIILMGGGSRLPRVHEILMEKSGKPELGKSVNTDEAAALGAVYQAAYLGKGFKVKTFHIKDANLFPINVEFEKQKSDDSGATDGRTIKRTLFGRMNPFPQRKVMTFNKHYKDFSFDVRYGDLDFLPEEERKSFSSLLLSNVSLHGIEAALEKHPSTEAEYKGVKAHFRMDESGILHMERVESVFEKQLPVEAEEKDESTWSKIGNAFGGLFGVEEGAASGKQVEDNQTETAADNSTASKSAADSSQPDEKAEGGKEEKKAEEAKKTEEEAPKAGEGEKQGEGEKEEEKKPEGKQAEDKPTPEEGQSDKTPEEKGEKDKGKAEVKDDKEEKKPAVSKVVSLKEEIVVDIEIKDLPDLSKEKFSEAKKRLNDLAKKDAEKTALQKAMNELEGFIFDTQDKLTQKAYEVCSTEAERESILKALSEAGEWLEEQPRDAKKEAYLGKLKDLKELMKNINLRVYEKEERPKALVALKDALNSSTYFLATVRNMTEAIFSDIEIAALEKLINDTKKWRDEAVAEQKKVANHENPTLLVEAIGSKIYALDREMKYLINKAKNYRPKAGKGNKTEKAETKANKTEKTEEAEKDKVKEEEKEDDADGNVEDEDDATAATPEAQAEAVPETESTDQTPDETVEKPEPVKEDESETASKTKHPKKKQGKTEEAKTDEGEILELGSDDLPTGETGDKHEEL